MPERKATWYWVWQQGNLAGYLPSTTGHKTAAENYIKEGPGKVDKRTFVVNGKPEEDVDRDIRVYEMRACEVYE